ncbi:arabinogalactan endo-1,4-beta-galactosidase [Nonlabens spongiae]|uniref:Arabinogalactan endo-beta-1,4-galactanase n=1 Tax=Nonlabens spongiae TaxID=331648 RepID=A0A1W6MI25_9FLAO|nr:glycosyl hydrolase 53 family protein [Nonlabens spongiae]ARN77255.1 arabinogalactan endo-1,4-beta-galactosidase [Nonlabens spongiae]
MDIIQISLSRKRKYTTMLKFIFAMTLLAASSCSDENTTVSENDDDGNVGSVPEPVSFYYGADLSYVNEMEDCGAIYSNRDGIVQDPYSIFAEEGANIVRLRLWHNPTWTNYSNLQDVKRSIQRAKDEGMQVLLDFHYSDTWTDPAKQQIPAAWIASIDDTPALGNLLYDYTYDTLTELASENLLPNIVQVGNEINPMILQDGDLVWPIDWTRNAALINKGILAVRNVAQEQNKEIEVMLHIAQPENGLWWFDQATDAGVTDYDWIGLSYYPIWSEYDLNQVQAPLTSLINDYNKKLMIVETAYPFTMNNADAANNILGQDALTGGFPASPQGQLDYLNRLQEVIENAGGQGLIYWEPAWVSTGCSTLWATGSHWDNATLFDQNNRATIGMTFYNATLND